MYDKLFCIFAVLNQSGILLNYKLVYFSIIIYTMTTITILYIRIMRHLPCGTLGAQYGTSRMTQAKAYQDMITGSPSKR